MYEELDSWLAVNAS